MKIAFLNAYGNGSTGRIVDKLKEICEANKIEVLSFFARCTCARNDETTVFSLNQTEFRIDALFTRLFDNHGLNSQCNSKRIIKRLKEFRPDIIHLHNLHGYWINYKLLFDFIKSNNIKVVWTFHDCWNFTGHCTHFDFIGCQKWKDGCHNCTQLKEYPASSGYDGSKRNYVAKKKAFTGVKDLVVVTPSDWLRSKVVESIFSEYNIKVIKNGIDISVFKPSANTAIRELIQSKGFSKIILGVAATWNERKGLRDILAIAEKESNWYFVIIGTVTDSSILSKEYKNVRFIDRTENVYELAEWYSNADVFVNPTLEDTYPTTNLESIACGTPVITYKTGGSEEIIKESGYGIITKERSSESLRDAIYELFENPSPILSNDFSFDAQDKYKEYLLLYNSLKA